MIRVTVLAALVLAACNGDTEDADGDGVPAPQDCDDTDKAVRPGALETCDGADNDCDGIVDDGLTGRWWPDADGDGQGDATAAATDTCTPDTTFVDNDTDCDDSQATVFVGADEDCGTVDRDCDGDPVAGATDAPTWYRDGDGDGFGRDDITQVGCEASDGYVELSGDCDDSAASRNPGASETCNGLDDDCDSETDESPIDGVTVYTDSDLDGYGAPGSGAIGCEGGGFVLDDTDCDDTNGSVNPDGTEVCNDGIDDDCDPTTGEQGLQDTFYTDGDGDGWGDAPVQACTTPKGAVDVPGDCDDGNASVNPDADEVCGGGDEDCDGQIDNDPVDGVAYHPDVDGDGFGADDAEQRACTAIPGWLLDDSDCADDDPLSYPGAPELCDAGFDNDCDPTTNDDTSANAATWYRDLDGDGHGDLLSTRVACLQPAGYVGVPDDCDDTDPDTSPSAMDVCDGGVDNDCDPTTDEELVAVWYADVDGDGYGDDLVTVSGCAAPPDYVNVGSDCDDTDPLINPLDTPGCVQDHCGTISVSTLWRNTVTHRVTCDVQVQGAAKPTLTIEDGTVVEFAPGAALEIGETAEGKLVVDGDVLGVTFTSDQDFPAPGEWSGLWIGRNDRGSQLVGLTVEYGGGNNLGGIAIDGGDPELDRVTVRENLGSGIYVSYGEPLIHDSSIVDNTDDGVYVAVGAGLSRLDELGTLGPSFQRNTITGNIGRPITLPGGHADEIEPTNVLDPNDLFEIGLLTGTLRFSGTWYDHVLPYVVETDAVIEVEDGPAAVLTIEDGVEVDFGVGSELRIGDGAGGRLEIVDGAFGVVFSATPEVLASSQNWDGVTFGADDTGSVVRNLTIEYGGGNARGNLHVSDSAPLFENIVSRYSDSNGLYVSGTTAAPEVRDSQLVDNDENGLYVESTSGIARSLVGPTFANNQLTGNGQSSAVMSANFIGQLDPSNVFSGNALRVRVHGGTVLEDALWRKLDEDYQITGTVTVGGPQDPELEIEDAVTLWFDRNTALSVGTVDDGALLIDAVLGVTMTSSDAAPGEGDWTGIEIGRNGLLRNQTSLRNVRVEYAGGSDLVDGGAIEVTDRADCTGREPTVTLREVHVVGSSKAGIYVEPGASAVVEDNVVDGALGGCWNVASTQGCLDPDITSFTNNQCLGGAVFGTWALGAVDALDPSSDFPGPVLVVDSVLESSVSMPALPVPYVFSELVSVRGASFPTLTVESGVELQFQDGAGLEVGVSQAGGLDVQPGAILTSYQTTPAPGDWLGVRLGSTCSVNVSIDQATIAYGGANGYGNVWVDGCDNGSIDDSAIENSASCGVYVAVGSSLSVGAGNTYVGNLGGDVCP